MLLQVFGVDVLEFFRGHVRGGRRLVIGNRTRLGGDVAFAHPSIQFFGMDVQEKRIQQHMHTPEVQEAAEQERRRTRHRLDREENARKVRSWV